MINIIFIYYFYNTAFTQTGCNSQDRLIWVEKTRLIDKLVDMMIMLVQREVVCQSFTILLDHMYDDKSAFFSPFRVCKQVITAAV